jgi:citronellol/citronellal dehydrogenase
MPESTPRYGLTDDQLKSAPTMLRNDAFSEQVVLVSGAGSGLGKATACLFARLGAKLVICGRDESKLARSQALMTELGAEVLALPINIRSVDQVDALMQAAWDKFGRLDIVINNAGGQFPQAAIDYTVKGWHAVIDTNLNGTWNMMQNVARRWRETGSTGCIINIVAVVERGLPGIAHTCAARAGVIGLSKSVAVEWAPLGIRVNCVAPGVIATEGFGQYPTPGLQTFFEANVFKRPGDAQDVAEACCYLSGTSGKFITGEVLNVDGGQQLWGDPWPTGRPAYFQL